jgi:hypothetical protein
MDDDAILLALIAVFVTPEGGTGSPHQYRERTRVVTRLYVGVEWGDWCGIRVYLWKRALRGETLSSHPGQGDETVGQRIAEHSLGRR